MNRCSFCFKKTNNLIEMGPKKNKIAICWYCLDIIQKWETFRWKTEKKEADQA